MTASKWIAAIFAIVLLPVANAQARSPATLERQWSEYFRSAGELRPVLAFPHQRCFEASAESHDLPLTLLLAVARGESDFNKDARSHANAHGLMQILWPSTAKHLGITRLSALYEPCVNVDAGARYLNEMLDRYNGNLHRALAAYNYGPRRIPLAGQIPDGANWYSGYIFRHLNFVLDRSQLKGSYAAAGRLTIATFRAPYRAAGFTEQIQAALPSTRIDWFRERSDRFRVVLLYTDAADLGRRKALLRKAGYTVPAFSP